MNPLLMLLGNILPGILDRILPGEDKETTFKKLEIQSELQKAITDQSVAQNQVNAAEATNTSVFVAGWRPFIGWVCGIGLLLVAFAPLFNYLLLMAKLPAMPMIANDDLYVILYGMLGLGGLRSFDKTKGTDTRKVTEE